MRKPPRLYSHDMKGMIPRMSWSPHNLYNLIARSTVPANISQISFKQVSATMFQQRWKSKRFLRGYHGDWIGERRFRRWYLPTAVPRLEQMKSEQPSSSSSSSSERGMTEEERLPVTSLFLRDVERRLDTVVHRCCFARSAREARALIVQGKVKLNGKENTFAGTLLNPGDLISIEPKSVPMLSEEVARRAAERKAAEMALNAPAPITSTTTTANEESASSTTETSAEAKSEEEKSSTEPVTEAATAEDVESAADQSSTKEMQPEPTLENKSEKGKAKSNNREKQDKDLLLPGVLPFNLPPFAAPFLFVPPYLEVSFTTCSAIYIRHPTITPAIQSQPQQRFRNSRQSTQQNVLYHSDIPSPYPATSDIFSLAWELYARDAPRIRSDVRRLRLEARVGRSGLRTARAKDQWRKVLAIRRKRDRQSTDSQMQSDDLLLQKTASEAASQKSKRKWSINRPINQFIVGRDGGPVQTRKKVLPTTKINLNATARNSAAI